MELNLTMLDVAIHGKVKTVNSLNCYYITPAAISAAGVFYKISTYW